MLDAKNGLRRVVEGEALGGGKGKAQSRMQETAAADEAFARILAEYDAVDAGEISDLVPPAGGGRAAILAGIGKRVADALGRRRMRRQEIRRPRINGAALQRLEFG